MRRKMLCRMMAMLLLFASCRVASPDSEPPAASPADPPPQASESADPTPEPAPEPADQATLRKEPPGAESAPGPGVHAARYRFTQPDGRALVDSYWLRSGRLVVMLGPLGDQSAEWAYYTLDFSSETALPSTQEELAELHSGYFSGQPILRNDYGRTYRNHPSAPSPLRSLDGARSVRVEKEWAEVDADSDPYKHIRLILTDFTGENRTERVIYEGIDTNLMDPGGCRPLGFLSDDVTLICQDVDEQDHYQVLGLLHTDTGEMRHLRFPLPTMRVEDFVPGLTDTVWVTDGSGGPSFPDQYVYNEIVDLATGEQRPIDVFAAYREQTGTPQAEFTTHSIELAKHAPVLICGFQNENELGTHLFLYHIPDGAVTPVVSSPPGVHLGDRHANLSAEGDRLAVLSRVAADGYALDLYDLPPSALPAGEREHLQTVPVDEILPSSEDDGVKKYLRYDSMHALTYAPLSLDRAGSARHGVGLPVVDGADEGYLVDGVLIVHPAAVAQVNQNGVAVQTQQQTRRYPDHVQPADGSVWFYQDDSRMTVFYSVYASDGRPHETALRILQLDVQTGEIHSEVEEFRYGKIADVQRHAGNYYILFTGEVNAYTVFVFEQENLEPVAVEQGEVNHNQALRLENRDGQFYLVYGSPARTAARPLHGLPVG